MNFHNCIHFKLECQKAALIRIIMENLQKDLNKLIQITMLQKTLAPGHTVFGCPEDPSLIAEPYSSLLKEVLSDLNSSSSPLQEAAAVRSTLKELLKQATFILDCDLSSSFNDCSQKEQKLDLSVSIPSPTRDNSEHLEHEKSQESSPTMRILVKEEYKPSNDEEEEQTVASNIQKPSKTVPKVDRMRHLGFKSHIEAKEVTSEEFGPKIEEQSSYREVMEADDVKSDDTRSFVNKRFNLKEALRKFTQKNPKLLDSIKVLDPEEQLLIKAQYQTLKTTLNRKRYDRIRAKQGAGELVIQTVGRTYF